VKPNFFITVEVWSNPASTGLSLITTLGRKLRRLKVESGPVTNSKEGATGGITETGRGESIIGRLTTVKGPNIDEDFFFSLENKISTLSPTNVLFDCFLTFAIGIPLRSHHKREDHIKVGTFFTFGTFPKEERGFNTV